jgi:hypothetical protein
MRVVTVGDGDGQTLRDFALLERDGSMAPALGLSNASSVVATCKRITNTTREVNGLKSPRRAQSLAIKGGNADGPLKTN